MFIVVLTYQKPLEEIDRLMADHVRFLEEGFRDGAFLAAGRQVPRKGGVLVAVAKSRDDLADRMARDPFVETGAATFDIVEFRASFHHPCLAPFAEERTRTMREVP